MQQAQNVSVVLCTYNGIAFIEAQLHTIINQTYKPYEIIIVDDLSTDGTYNLLKKLAAENPIIKLQQNESNLGFNKNFEKACGFASGQFIAIADQDDIWALNKLAIMLQAYNGQADILHCNSLITNNPEKAALGASQKAKRFNGNNINSLIFYNTVEGHCMLVKKSFLQFALPFPAQGYYDWWLALVACQHNGVQWVNQTLVARRLHNNNASNNQSKTEAKAQLVLSNLKNIMPLLATDKTPLTKAIIIALEQKNSISLKAILKKHFNEVYFFKSGFSKLLKKQQHINKLTYTLLN